MTGRTCGITNEFTVWCSRCAEWHQESIHRKSQFEKMVRGHGWRQRRGLWVCPTCIAGVAAPQESPEERPSDAVDVVDVAPAEKAEHVSEVPEKEAQWWQHA